ncbi:MAG: tandem-95 repeat protein, partial [Chloroflexi bacterium]
MNIKTRRFLTSLFVGLGMIWALMGLFTISPTQAQEITCDTENLFTKFLSQCDTETGNLEEAPETESLWLQNLVADEAPPPAQNLDEAYQRVLDAGAYDFSSVIQQTLVPRAIPEMIGETNHNLNMYLDGEVELPGNGRLRLSVEGAGLDPTPVMLVHENGSSFMMKENEQIPIENPVGFAAPTGDYLSYLAAAENVQPCDITQAPLPDATTCYTFDINGEHFAEFTRIQMQKQMQANGTLHPNSNLEPSLMLSNMVGSGKIWIDANGLPLRQKVDLDFTELSDLYDARVSMVTDYEFDETAVQTVIAAQTPVKSLLSWDRTALNRLGTAVNAAVPNAVILLFFVVSVLLLIALRRRRWMYTFVAVAIILIMLTTPMLQVVSYTRFYTRQAAFAASKESLIETLAVSDTVDAVEMETNTEMAVSQQDIAPAAVVPYEPSSYCGLGGNSDRDGDGLADDTEHCLGTDPNNPDSDGDLIMDSDEVQGFVYGQTVSRTWYTDPLNPDSNNDGLDDGSEWMTVEGGSLGTAVSWDIDKDGVPNVWDEDDDGDSVSDRIDLSPGSRTQYISNTTSISNTGGVTTSTSITNPFSFTINDSYDGYIYVTLQVQPSDLTYLQYASGYLDWPYDKEGHIQDRDGSVNDIRIVPMLAVDMNKWPDSELAEEYYVNPMKVDDDGDNFREVLIPLNVLENGGRVEALSAHMAYGPETLKDLDDAGIQWRNARILWLVQANNDSENDNGDVTTKSSVVHTYTEPAFRITGWQVTKSGQFRSAILGTPDFPDDDRHLFQLMFGLSASFLSYKDPDLDEIKARFSGANTPIEQKWGITTTVAVDLPASSSAHFDEGLKGLDDQIETFLAEHYTWDTPNAVIVATESDLGAYTQDFLDEFEPSISTMGVDLDDISMGKQRTLNLQMRDRWKAFDEGEVAEALFDRLPLAVDDALVELQDQYPALTASDLFALSMSLYMTWHGGRSRLLNIDGLASEIQSRPDTDIHKQLFTEPRDRHNDPANINTLPGYLVEVGHFGKVGGGFLFKDSGVYTWQYFQANKQTAAIIGFTQASTYLVELTSRFLQSELKDATSFEGADWHKKKSVQLKARVKLKVKTNFIKGRVFQSAYKGISNLLGVADTSAGLKSTGKLAKLFTKIKTSSVAVKLAKVTKVISKIAKRIGAFLGVGLFVLDIVITLVTFFMEGDYSSEAIGMLVATIAVSIALYLIGLTHPVGAVAVALVGLVDLFLYLFGVDFSVTGAVAKWLYDAFKGPDYSATEVGEFDFKDYDVFLRDPEMGFVVGNRLTITSTFAGHVEVVLRKRSPINPSKTYIAENGWICGRFENKVENLTKSIIQTSCPNTKAEVTTSGNLITYTNQMSMTVIFNEGNVNQAISFVETVDAQTLRWSKALRRDCRKAIKKRYCYELDKESIVSYPDKLPEENQWEPTTFYVDLLPKTVQELWFFSDIINHDPDGDGMSSRNEINELFGSQTYGIMSDDLTPFAVGTLKYRSIDVLLTQWDKHETHSTITAWCSNNPDYASMCNTNEKPIWLNWDRDGDGLSDGFEFDNIGLLGTDNNDADTDNDGLNDGFEYRMGTRIDAPDSDMDGLLDNEEVFYKDTNGDWQGGWDMVVEKYGAVGQYGRFTTTVHIFPNPTLADTDLDGLSDKVEQENVTSPYGFNRAPRVTLEGSPYAESPAGLSAVYIKAGEEISFTATVEAFEPISVASTLELTVPWSLLSAAQFDKMHGNSAPNNTGQPAYPAWSFAKDPLLPEESSYTIATAQTANLSQSMTGTAQIRLPMKPAGWLPVGVGAGSDSFSATIYAMAEDPDDHTLYAGGQFDKAGGRSADGIARWNGSSWGTVGFGIDGTVYAIVIAPNGDVYAGGHFYEAGGKDISYIARWDGTQWHALGSGVDSYVYAMAMDSNGDLFVAGDFTKAGGTIVNYVAKWDGSSWSALGSGTNETATAIAVAQNGDLIVGGMFTKAGNVSSQRIARWNGSSWLAMPGLWAGMYESVGDIAFDPENGDIYAAGSAVDVSGQSSHSNIARWTGTAWTLLPDIASNPDSGRQYANTLAFGPDGNLYAGGWWAETTLTEDHYFARWDGTNWDTDLGDFSGYGVYSLLPDENGMYVGGTFSQVDDTTSENVAYFAIVDGQVQESEVTVVVDADSPRLGLIEPHYGQIIGGGVTDYVIGGYTREETTWVTEVEIDLPVIGSTTLTRSQSLSPWAYTWNLPADGVYNLAARTTDFVGNVSSDDNGHVMIDNTPASVTVNLSDGAVYGPPENSGVITITLDGTASDNLSGLTRVQISTDGGPWREVWTLATATVTNSTTTTFSPTFHDRMTGATWEAVWTLPNVESVQGYHSIRVRAFDEASNWPTILERTIIVDVIPPTDELLNRAYLHDFPHVTTNEAHTFYGVVNDVGNVPEPSRPTELVGDLDSVEDATIWLGLSDIAENDAGVTVDWIGDFNGDRRADLLVGLPSAANGAGEVMVVYGRSGDWPVPDAHEMLASSTTSFVGTAGAGIGAQALSAGDVNGDGIADLLIGDPNNNRVFLIFGQTRSLGRDILLNSPHGGARVVLLPPDGEQIGQYIGAAGDVNGDGYADMLIGATGSTDKVYLLLGESHPWFENVKVDTNAAVQVVNIEAATLTGVGDLDGDFNDEFVLGAGNNLYLFEGKASYAPKAGLALMLSNATHTFASSDATPTAAALGDVNEDNLGDFIYSNGGSQQLVFGDGTLDGSWTTQTFNYGSGFLAGPGDVDNDGRADILIGGGGNAYLVLGSDLGSAESTISGVAMAASAPNAAGADLNSDGSSDLLLVPAAPDGAANGAASTTLADLPPAWVPRVAEQNLDTFVGATTFPDYPGADAYVNDDGVCYGRSPCYTTIQDAIDNSITNDLIIIQPGVYSSFTVSNKNYLTIQGMNADAVFIDGAGGSYAAQIINSLDVQLKHMTLRNADYGVRLEDAGIYGHLTMSNRTSLDHLLIYDVNTHDIYMSRSSTVSVTHSTLVANSNHVGIFGDVDFRVTTGWSSAGTTPWAIDDGGGATAISDTVYVWIGNGGGGFSFKDMSTGSGWSTPWGPPGKLEPDSVMAAGSDGQIYAIGAPDWNTISAPPDQIDGMVVHPNNEHIYAAPQLGSSFYIWDGSSWTTQGGAPHQNYTAIAIDPTNGDVYMGALGGDVVKWNGSNWTTIHTFVGGIHDIVPDSQGDIYISGAFDGYFAKWDGSTMTILGQPDVTGDVEDMIIDPNDNIYLAGYFDYTFNSDGYLQKWSTSGNEWQYISDGGITDTVKALAYNERTNKLYACGDFASSDVAVYDDAGSWTFLPPIESGPNGFNECHDLDYSGQIYVSGEWDTGELYDQGGGIFTHKFIYLARWDDVGNKWEPQGAGGIRGTNYWDWVDVEEIVATNKGLIFSGQFDFIGEDEFNQMASDDFGQIHFFHAVYSPTANSWTTLPPPPAIGSGASYGGSADGKMALIRGGGSNTTYFYDIASQSWDSLDTLDVNVTGSAMTMGKNENLYAIVNGGQFCSSGDGRYWSCSANGDIDEGTMGTVSDGASLAYDPVKDTFYAFPGGNSTNMLRHRDGSWELLDSGNFTPQPIRPGGDLVYIPGATENSLYAIPGGNNNAFWHYPLPEPNKIGFEHSAIVAPATAQWLNVDAFPDDFNYRMGEGNMWFGGTGWTPEQRYALPESGADPFLDQTRDLYRMGEDGFAMGYHTYTMPVTATTTAGIQDAINSGANRVIVKPGIYEESLYLVNGVEIVGSNPDWVIVRPPNGSTLPLVHAEGVAGTSLSRITLDGKGSGLNGLVVTGRGQHNSLSRVLIKGTETAVLVDAADSDIEIANATIVQNNNGLSATNCASIDVRNTIFAYQTGTGLSHEGCAAVKLHTYNLYWANSTDFGGTADAGAAELFLDPNFVDPFDNDYRTLNYSPVIDAGNPTDPPPPGAGNRIDIGYIEQGRANFFVDDDYCELCENDGLSWGIDAFDTIQAGLNTAQNTLTTLSPGIGEVPQLIVGVGPGTYNEQLTIPSHVILMGSGAEETLLDLGGGDTAVTFNGVTDAGINNFTIKNATTAISVTGASNTILIDHNIFDSNTTGMIASDRSTPELTFSTFVNNGTAINADGNGTWASVSNNIFSGSGVALSGTANGQVFSKYNLLNMSTNYDNVFAGEGDITGSDPLFAGGAFPYRLTANSPALDAASRHEQVPEGGGLRADLGYSELLAAPILLLLGQEDLSTVMGNSGVKSVETAVVEITDSSQPVTATLPSSWISVTLDSPGATFSYWQSDFTPDAEGLYRFYSRATDMVDNQEEDEIDWYDGSFVADSVPPTITWIEPLNGASVNAPIELRAQVSDYAADDFSVAQKDVYFDVGGTIYAATWAAEPWDEDAQEPRIFRAWITPTVGSYTNVTAYAEDKAGNSASDNSLSFDIVGNDAADVTAPLFTVDAPSAGAWLTHTVAFSGTVSDVESGVAAVEVSLDGGTSWHPATVSGSDWSLTWDGPEYLPFVSYPAWVKATDRAGNTNSSPLVFSIDEVPPSGLDPVAFSAPVGTHFDVETSLMITWTAALDSSGILTTYLTVDQITDTISADAVTGNTASATLNANGKWYVHLAAMDAVGNTTFYDYGPWYVGIDNGSFGSRQQSIIVDGYVDTANGEWEPDTDYLDNDARTVGSEVTYSPTGKQAFYTAWDSDDFFMAWRGGWWTLDGELWIYLNSGGGGSSALITPLQSAPSAQLPFDANYAVQVTSPLTGTLWEYSGSWQPSALDWEFVQGNEGDTEVRLPLVGTSNIETLSFGLGDNGRVWAIFPATNPLNPVNSAPSSGMQMDNAQTSGWVPYHWDDITVVDNVADNQPIATSLALTVDSLQAPSANWGPGGTLEYVVQVDNQESEVLTGVEIDLTAVSSTAIIHDSIEGASCTTTNPWQCTLDPLAPGKNTITLTTHLASDLADNAEVTLTAALQNVNVPPELPSSDSITHQLDNQPPVVTISNEPFVTTGPQIFQGTADDGDGAGVAYVEVRPEYGSWQTVQGTEFWSADLTVLPFLNHGETWQIEVRAADAFGQVSAIETMTFTVDLESPILTFTPPAMLGGDYNQMLGTALDDLEGSEAVQVTVQLDSEPWKETAVYAPDETGEQQFLWMWEMPAVDGVTYTLRVEAEDIVGNVGTLGTPQQVWVDTVAPQITVTTVLTQVAMQHYPVGGSGVPVLSGSMSDGSDIAAVTVNVELPNGEWYDADGSWGSGTWQFAPELELIGDYLLQVKVRDVAGNLTKSDSYTLTVVAAPDSGPNHFYTLEDTPIVFQPLLDDIDLDGDDLLVASISVPTSGAAALQSTVDVVYTPTLNFNGQDVFTYVASDGDYTDTATITVTVTAVNDAPTIDGSSTIAITIDEDTPTSLNFSSADVDGDSMSWSIGQGGGTAVVSNTSGVNNVNAAISYTPVADANGADSFTVQVNDGEYNDTVTVNVTIDPINDAPRPIDDYLLVVPSDKWSPMTLNVLANDEDVEGDSMNLTAVGDPSVASTAYANSNQVAFTPILDVGDTETFTYTVSDGQLAETAVVHIKMVAGDKAAS